MAVPCAAKLRPPWHCKSTRMLFYDRQRQLLLYWSGPVSKCQKGARRNEKSIVELIFFSSSSLPFHFPSFPDFFPLWFSASQKHPIYFHGGDHRKSEQTKVSAVDMLIGYCSWHGFFPFVLFMLFWSCLISCIVWWIVVQAGKQNKVRWSGKRQLAAHLVSYYAQRRTGYGRMSVKNHK